MYGNGVHAYFSQDYVKAHQFLTTAIEAHTQDPRCYYFRGLVDNKLGRPQDAELDFKEGAKLENNVDLARSYGVARSLERIQGPERAALEQFRLEARAAILKKSEEQDRVRYERTRKETDQFLNQESKVAPPDKTEKVDVPPPLKANADPFNPGGEAKKPDASAEKPADPSLEKPAEKPTEPPKADDKPEVTPEKPAAKSGDPDPFGGASGGKDSTPDKSADKAMEKPAGKPEKPAADAGDPFGATPPAAAPPDKPKDNKKDDAPPPAAADAKKDDAPAAPAEKKPDAGAADPFKEEPEKKDDGAAKTPDAKEAPKEPAKDAKPADKKPDADPFG
jgi:hypothetical protein